MRFERVRRIDRDEQREVEHAYARLNRRFNSILPPIGRGMTVTLSGWRQSDDVGVLLGDWRRTSTGHLIRLYADASPKTLCHEMVHAALWTAGLPNGHSGAFARVSRDVGLPVDAHVRRAALAEIGAPAGAVACYRFAG